VNLTNKKLARWFAKQAKMGERFTSIYDMLFADKSLRYMYFRLRYFKLVTVVQFLFHALVFYILYRYSSTYHIYQVGGHWLMGLLIAGAWWGVLEVLRTQVRELYYSYAREKAALLIGKWLIVVTLLSACSLAVASYYAYVSAKQFVLGREFWVSGFSAVIWCGIAIRIWMSTYHAGIYAITRILRPITSLLYGEIIAMLVFYAAWHSLKMAAIPLMLLTHTLINEALRYYYCKRMYRFREFLPVIQKPELSSQGFPWIDAYLSGLSGIFIHFSGAIMGLAWLLPQGNAHFNTFYAMIFLLLPLLEASTNWAMLFYFDWKKLQRINFDKLHAKYDRYILWLSPVMGAFFWALAAIAGALLLPQFSWSMMLLLLPVLVLRSIIAYLQIRAFANFRYLDVIVSGFIGVLGMILAYYFTHNWQIIFLSFLTSLVISLIWLLHFRLPAYNRLAIMRKYIFLYDWLNMAGGHKQPLRIYQLGLKQHLFVSTHMQVIAKIVKQCLGEQGRVCHLDENTLLILQAENSDQPLLPVEKIIELCGGFLTSYDCSELFKPAQYSALMNYLLKQIIKHNPMTRPDLPLTLDSLKSAFLTQNPLGIFFGPEQELGAKAKKLDNKTLQQLMSSLQTILYCHLAEKQQQYVLLPVYADHSIVGICALPTHGSKKIQTYWKNLIHDFNLALIFTKQTHDLHA
jgi:hypothetical protein